MGPRPSVPTRVRSPALTEGRSVVLVVDPQWSTPPELLADLLHQAVLPSSDPLWPGRFPPMSAPSATERTSGGSCTRSR